MSFLVGYVISLYKGSQEASSRHTNIEDRNEAGAAYELMHDTRHEPGRTTANVSGVNTSPVDNDDICDAQTTTRYTTPHTEEVKEGIEGRSPESVKRRQHRYRVLFGLALPFALQSLDTTIIASALPFIAQDFEQVKQLNWIISVFNMTSAAFLPFWAQIADVFGRHVTIHSTILIMAIGSAICTGAPTSQFGVLLFGRALQGVGAAGVNVTGHVIMADRVSLEDFAWNWTLSAVISAGFFGIGPVVGGHLTQVNWRWCFAINLPIAVVGIVLIVIVLGKDLVGPQPIPGVTQVQMSTRARRLWVRFSTVDFGGQLLFLSGLTLLILAFTWAGGAYPWDSVQVLVPLIIGAGLTATWLAYEYLMSPPHLMSRLLPLQKAMMPWELLQQKNVRLIFFINFTMGMAMFSVMYFMDLYFALVLGSTPSEAGKNLLYYLPGLAVGAYMAQYATNTWPRETFPPLFLGSITSAVGITVLAWATHVGETSTILGMMALTGHGVGMRMSPSALHGLAFFPDMTVQITCLVSLAVPLGGTVALTMMSTVFNNKSGPNNQDAKEGIMYAFVSLIPFMWLCVVCTTFLGNAWILDDDGHEVAYGNYFWSWAVGAALPRERRDRGSHNTTEAGMRTVVRVL
ncbi:hypothetical protein N8I77_006969 [Diaporthe amygdali]|uniref:Major facilitator superfamily (MFS) profile domain-containing protein n=1 Tax=Phomopsis amygdali TaxID=1214568 RepID=A0AAD9SK77_PHOAM|nr:hypothetical protein N8I77_006969 [Diaporthe amygdali]